MCIFIIHLKLDIKHGDSWNKIKTNAKCTPVLGADKTKTADYEPDKAKGYTKSPPCITRNQ